jgi:DNA-binding transcriptional regulator YhcF (GntR family)
MDRPDFSRNSARKLGPNSPPLSDKAYRILERARILCTRGVGERVKDDEVERTQRELDGVYDWMRKLVEKAKQNERIQ